jgi:hypothetical protein
LSGSRLQPAHHLECFVLDDSGVARQLSVSLGSGRASFNLTTDIFDDHDLKSSPTKVFPSGFPQIASVTFAAAWEPT